MDTTSSFGEWLRRRRRALDLTRDELALHVGCAAATIKKIEADERRPSKQLAERLAVCLDIPDADRAAFLKAARAELAVDRLNVPPEPPLSPPIRQPQVRPTRPPALRGYTLHEQLGAGGFGAVYRATQPGVGRDVAIKIILPEHANHPEFIRRFEAEAQLIARLEHPHIVPLYDYWREPGGAYLVMRYIRGGSLQTALRAGSWSLDQSARLLDQVGSALAFAHRHGIVHRDLKPANILLDEEGSAYLADFGIAKDLVTPGAGDTTQPGAVVGTPDYLSPEQIKDEPITLQTDIYGLGVLLYEALTGAHPFAHLPPAERLSMQLHEPLPLLAKRHPDLPVALDAVIQRATAKMPAERYPDVLSTVLDWQRASGPGSALAPTWSQESTTVQITSATPNGAPLSVAAPGMVDNSLAVIEIATVKNPYKGLRAFREADAADYFGRMALTQQLLERLAAEDAEARFLAVVGPSGSGKSSVVRAGLIPALRRGGLPGSERWFVVELLPGAHPLDELEAALLRIAVNPPASLLEQLQSDERGLARAVKRALPADEEIELVILIDQFEELFTLTVDEDVRKHVLASLRAAILDSHSRLRVIVTLRADFYDRPLLYGGFGELMRERTEVVLPLTPEELEQAIAGPAARVGVVAAPELVAAIIKDVGEQPGTLPLLQYALTDLFERRQGRTLTLAAYRETGGVRGALARRADELYDALDANGQTAARQLFLRLITLGEGIDDTRRRTPRAELTALTTDDRPTTDDRRSTTGDDVALSSSVLRPPSVMDPVIDTYGRARLLSFDRDPITRGPTVEVAHEALLHEWWRLRTWLDASRADVRMQRLLTAAAAEWTAADHDPSYLLAGARLAQFAGWAEQTDVALTADERTYLDASVAERGRVEQAEHERQQRELEQARAVQDSFVRSERQRLAAEANLALDRGESGDLPALLALRSLRIAYSPEADGALLRALERPFTRYRLAGHRGELYTAALSPDGRYALTGGGDGLARLWDVATGQQIRQFSHGAISDVFSPDSKAVLTTDGDTTAWLWDFHTGREIRQFNGHTDRINKVAFSRDGQYVLTASADKTVRLWNAQTGLEIRQFNGHTESVNSVAFSPDGKYALTASADKTVRLWNAQTGLEIRQFTGHTYAVNDVAFSPDGKYLVTGSGDKTARLWDVATGQEIRHFTGHTAWLSAVAFSYDGTYLVTGSGDQTARLWEVATGRQLLVFIGHTKRVVDVAISPDSKTLLTSGDFVARLWDIHLDTEPRMFIGHTDGVPTVAVSPDGRHALTGSADQTARLWDIATGRTVHIFRGFTDGVWSVAFTPDDKQALTVSFDNTAHLWDRTSGQEIWKIAHACSFSRAAFAPDGTTVFIGCYGGVGELYDVRTGQRLRRFSGSNSQSSSGVAFAPDGKTVLSADFNGTISQWNVATGQEVRIFRGHTSIVANAAFSPDGKYILSSGLDGTARLWDAATGREIRQFVGHVGPLGGDVAFSPDGRYALTAGFDKTVRLWDVATGQQVRLFPTDPGASLGDAFSPDGKYVLTGNEVDGIARMWRVDLQEVLRFACATLPRDLTAEERVTYSITDDAPTCPKP